MSQIWDDGCLDGAVEALKGLDGSTQRIGRAKKHHGEVSMTLNFTAQELPQPPRTPAVALRLMTDTYLVDEFGFPDPTAAALAAHLADRLDTTVEVTTSAVGVSRRDSWNARHGLSRSSVVALAAGSAVHVTIKDPEARRRLPGVLAAGLGQLTVEGYGRVCYLGEVPQLREEDGASQTSDADVVPPTDESWRALADAMWRDEIAERCTALYPRVRRWLPGRVDKSMVRTLRSAAVTTRRTATLEPLQRWATKRAPALGSVVKSPDEARRALKEVLGDDLPIMDAARAAGVLSDLIVAYCRHAHRDGRGRS